MELKKSQAIDGFLRLFLSSAAGAEIFSDKNSRYGYETGEGVKYKFKRPKIMGGWIRQNLREGKQGKRCHGAHPESKGPRLKAITEKNSAAK